MNDTIHRQWCLLSAIPREPRTITVEKIQQRLNENGYRVSDRTVQRDLVDLSTKFPLVCNDQSKPYGWSWLHNARVLDIPGMDSEMALTFSLAEMFLTPALPPAMRDRLQPHFLQARAILETSPLKNWSEHVRIIPRGQPLKAPAISPNIVQCVYEALLHQKRINITYYSRTNEKNKKQEANINPLALVLRNTVAYLVCNYEGYEDTRHLALHRIKKATLSDEPVNRPASFNLDSYIKEGRLDIPVGNKIKLVARFTKGAAFHLEEGGLSDDQTISSDDKDNWLTVTATVQDTSQLRWWLLGFGAQVEVLKPAHLRNELASTAKKMATLY